MYANPARVNDMQPWIPIVLSLFGTLIVVVLTAWLNTRTLSAQVEALRAEVKQGFAELRLEFQSRDAA